MPEDALVGASALLLQVEDRTLTSLGVHAELHVQPSLLYYLPLVADPVVAAVIRMCALLPAVRPRGGLS